MKFNNFISALFVSAILFSGEVTTVYADTPANGKVIYVGCDNRGGGTQVEVRLTSYSNVFYFDRTCLMYNDFLMLATVARSKRIGLEIEYVTIDTKKTITYMSLNNNQY